MGESRKNPEQLKGAIRNIANEKNLHAQEVLQIYMFERIIERLVNSPYQENFILKGGLLIASIIGIEERTTIDMDTTIKGLSFEEETIEKIIKEILSVNIDDGVTFKFLGIDKIREDDFYGGFRVRLSAEYGKMKIPMKMDITTGDKITPKEIDFKFHLMFEEKTVLIKAYPVETILAEKFETIIRRSVGNSRARDYYDLYVLYMLKKDKIDIKVLSAAINATALNRESLKAINDYDKVIKAIEESKYMRSIWDAYKEENAYVNKVKFEDTIMIIREIASICFGEK